MGLFSGFSKKKKHKDMPPLDAASGQEGIVIETVGELPATGTVKVNGNIWSARPVMEGEVYPVGTKVVVVAEEGVKLIVRRA